MAFAYEVTEQVRARQVTLDLEESIREADAQLDIRTENCAAISFSPKNLRSIVYNLLSNAIKYRSPDRPLLIHIGCYELPGSWVLEVTDNGLDMDLSQESKIFAMFKRLHTHVEGSGIGLYIVKKIIDNAGGKIAVESEVDKGSVFRVYFKR